MMDEKELTGELKQQVEQTSGMEEAASPIMKAGHKLTDEELDQVSGGAATESKKDPRDSHRHPLPAPKCIIYKIG